MRRITFQAGLKNIFQLKKSRTYVISDLNCEEILGTFCNNELTNQDKFRKLINASVCNDKQRWNRD